MKPETIFPLIFILIELSVFAQEDNLVPNPGFDIAKGKVKVSGQIEISQGWQSATSDKADLFCKTAKAPEYLVPLNNLGSEDTYDGDCYAGIVMEGYRGAPARTYLQSELKSPLEAGKSYCIKFHISLADLSKYACNNIGLYVSMSPITSVEISRYDIVPQIIHSRNRVFEEQYGWEAICDLYEAKGGEKFITIGNFYKSDDTEIKKMQRPKGMTKPQIAYSYYYVENVSVIPADKAEECVCEKKTATQPMNVVYKTNVSTDAKIDNKKRIEYHKIFFAFKSLSINEASQKELDTVVKLLKENTGVKIEVQGHAEPYEQQKLLEDISAERANVVRDYIISKGIDEERLLLKYFSVKKPLMQGSDENARTQNRRVEFRIVDL